LFDQTLFRKSSFFPCDAPLRRRGGVRLKEKETETNQEYDGGIGTKAEGRLEMALVCWKGKGEPALYMAVKAVGVSEGF